MSALIKQLKQD